MKYYSKCQKLLGNQVFSELVEILLNKIINKFSNKISVNEFVKILEINIDAILMLGLAQAFTEKRISILNDLVISQNYLVCNSIDEFEKEFLSYIKAIAITIKKN